MRESMLDNAASSLWITVTREESMVSGDTTWFVPTGNKEDGLGGGFLETGTHTY